MTENKTSMLRNCKKCNRVFSSPDGNAFCSRCSDDVDDGFTRVREFIYDNPTCSIKEVSTGTGVASDIVLKWIREGRIILGENASISFCERCSTPINGGRFCGKCIHDLANGLKEGIGANDNRPKMGMHIKEGEKNKK